MLTPNARAFVRSWLAVPLALLSGGFMMAAGYLLPTVGRGAASLAMIPGGVLIFGALRLARGRRPTPDDASGATGPGVGSQLVIFALTMASGAVMVVGGHTLAARSWVLAATLALVGGVFILGAFTIAATPRHGRRQP